MPYTLAWEPKGVIKTFTGFVTGEEFDKSAEDVVLDERFNDSHYIVNDFLAISGHEIDAEKIQWVTSIRVGSHSFNSGLRVAILTTDADIMRIAKKTAPNDLPGAYETRAFETMQQARQWLDSPPD